ncbi:hypothetical protein DYB26_012664 [Aphanomyces astaci]|uniref:AB hydrolase-1 domain-containing protein n=1 Tax=Aphanomyces astaci TaxID=112090 RepID=A0A3R7DDW7_APHAT|nr:hypothetical protein DYB34_000293 [Aphanomyces astaci]RHZ37857.1 hypothetical protein DYB26_012664 [Aphanomyces astaci]
MSTPAPSVCPDCQKHLGAWFNRGTACALCSRVCCATCLDFALYTDPTTISSMCKACFTSKWALDMTQHVEVFGPSIQESAGPAVVLVHGGGGCRSMFIPLAKSLAAVNVRCVLVDLPGHGSRMDELLTLDSAIAVILEGAALAGTWRGDVAPVYVGGSLGGYIGMELLGQHPTMFSKAVILMCGQNIGVNRGWAAGLGLIVLDWVSSTFSAATLLKLMHDQVQANGHLDRDMIENDIKKCGFFFHQSKAQIAILKATNPAEALKKYRGPVLFINGSKDHRDSDAVWLAAASAPASKLIVYDGADHFFSHDTRYLPQFLDELHAFVLPTPPLD